MVLNFAYGPGRRIRVVSWSLSYMVDLSIQDSRIKDRWVREGPPSDARLIDVILQKNTQLGHSCVHLVIEHESFEPVDAGNIIPKQPVVMLSIQDAMHLFLLNQQSNDGA